MREHHADPICTACATKEHGSTLSDICTCGKIPMTNAATPRPTVKPLEWAGFVANTPFGRYEVVDARNRGLGFGIRKPNGDGKCFYKSENTAKAAAQTDYDKRILSALKE